MTIAGVRLYSNEAVLKSFFGVGVVVLMLRLLQCRQNESVYGFLGLLRRVETAIDDAVKPSYTLILVYLRALMFLLMHITTT